MGWKFSTNQGLAKSLTLAIFRLLYTWFWSSLVCESAGQQLENLQTWIWSILATNLLSWRRLILSFGVAEEENAALLWSIRHSERGPQQQGVNGRDGWLRVNTTTEKRETEGRPIKVVITNTWKCTKIAIINDTHQILACKVSNFLPWKLTLQALWPYSYINTHKLIECPFFTSKNRPYIRDDLRSVDLTSGIYC